MPYIKKEISFLKDEKTYQALIRLGYDMKNAQSIIDRGMILNSVGKTVKKNEILNDKIFIISYECEPKGLKPIFEDENFAVFDKPSGVLTHPNGRNTIYCMNDEIWHLYGRKSAVTHRLDKETSGVLLVAKNKIVEKKVKLKFEKGEIHKSYLAMVKGIIKNDFEIVENIGLDKNSQSLKNKIYVRKDGKFSKTKFKVIEIFPNLNATLLECMPITGRQHQIRVHMFHVKHPIVGDTMYGVDDSFAENFLDEKISDKNRVEITGASRLLLHSQSLFFEFDGKIYDIKSKFDAKSEFLKCVKV